MKSLRLASIVWILAAIVAGLLAAFLLGIGEHPDERAMGLFLAPGALLAAGTGTLGLVRPTIALARWSVFLAVLWGIGTVAIGPGLRFEADRVLFALVPAVLPVVAGVASLSGATRRGPG